MSVVVRPMSVSDFSSQERLLTIPRLYCYRWSLSVPIPPETKRVGTWLPAVLIMHDEHEIHVCALVDTQERLVKQ